MKQFKDYRTGKSYYYRVVIDGNGAIIDADLFDEIQKLRNKIMEKYSDIDVDIKWFSVFNDLEKESREDLKEKQRKELKKKVKES
jgi:hypothetical protein